MNGKMRGASGRFRISAVLCVILACCFLPSGSFFAKSAGTVNKGVFVEGVDLGGLTRGEMSDAIDEKVRSLSKTPVTFHLRGETISASLGDFGLTWTNKEILDEIMGLGSSGNILKRYMDKKDIEQNRMEYELTFQADSDMVEKFAGSLSAYNTEPTNATIYTTDELLPGVEGGEEGITVQTDKTARRILDAVSAWDGESSIELDVPVERVQPEVPYEELAMICDPLGTATTDYSFSSYERSVNIQNGCSKISGTLLNPGDYFSVTDAVTPFTAENGYEPAPSYEENRVVNSYGGGICQVSTTLYNAVLKAELEVTARSNHTMAVSYVDLSKDAAIAEGSMDMCFVNTKDDPVYIIGYAYNGTLSFTIYGHETRPSNRTIELVSVTTGTMEPSAAMLYANTEQNVGYINQTQSPHTGYTAELWKNVYVDGEQVDSIQINSSYYNAVGTIYEIGVASSNPALTQAMYTAISSNDLNQVQSVIMNGASYGTTQQSESSAGNAGGENTAWQDPNAWQDQNTGQDQNTWQDQNTSQDLNGYSGNDQGFDITSSDSYYEYPVYDDGTTIYPDVDEGSWGGY